MRNKRVILIITFLIVLICNSQGFSLEEKTHQAINEYIAQNTVGGFSLNDYLKNNLGFKKGVEEVLTGIDAGGNTKNKEIFWWLGYGGEQEDRPGSITDYILNKPTRSVNHFHNPLKAWNEAGLNDYVLGRNYTGQSSILWAQNPNQSPGGNWSWKDTRDYFYKALTSTSKADRERYFANTLRAVGQLMHLVEDASVPQHSRNDIHILPAYEAAVEKMRTNKTKYPTQWSTWINNPISFDRSILDIPLTQASVPISRIIDTDKYDGTTPHITTGLDIGMAEYANANFLSEDTMFTDGFDPNHRHYFPYPRRTAASLWTDITNKRQYLKKTGDGENVDHLTTVSFLYLYRQRYFPQYDKYLPVGLDDKCHEDYASLLIPRAVGYSAGLLNYFFRGEIDMVPDDESGYGYVIENNTEEDMEGTFELYYDNTDDERIQLWSGSFTLGTLSSGNNRSSNITFTPPTDAKEPGKYMLVFRGRMGAEDDAVAGRQVEFQPVVNLYYIYRNGTEPALGLYGDTCTPDMNVPILDPIVNSTELREYVNPQAGRGVTLKAVHQTRHTTNELDYYLIEVAYLIEEWYGTFKTKAIYVLDRNRGTMFLVSYVKNRDNYARVNVSRDKRNIYVASFSNGQHVQGFRIDVQATIDTFSIDDNWNKVDSQSYQSWYKFGWVDEKGEPVWNHEESSKNSTPMDIEIDTPAGKCSGVGCTAWSLYSEHDTTEHSKRWSEVFQKDYHFRRNNGTSYYTIETHPYRSQFDSDSGWRRELLRECTDWIECPGSTTPCSGEGTSDLSAETWHKIAESISFIGYTSSVDGDCTYTLSSQGNTWAHCGGADFESTQTENYRGSFSRNKKTVTVDTLWIGEEYWLHINEINVTGANQQKTDTQHRRYAGIPGSIWDLEPPTITSTCDSYCPCQGCPQGAYYCCFEQDCLNSCWQETTDPFMDEVRIWTCSGWDCMTGEATKSEKIYIVDPYSNSEIPARFVRDEIFSFVEDYHENLSVEGLRYADKDGGALSIYRNRSDFGNDLLSCSGIRAEDLLMLLVY